LAFLASFEKVPDEQRIPQRRLWTRVTVDPYAWNAAGLRGWRKAGFVDIETHGADDEHVAPWVLMEFSRR
jgi:hypothetical protein